MRTWTLIALAALLLVSPALSANTPSRAPAVAAVTIAPDLSLGGVRLGDSHEQVKQTLGRPDEVSILKGIGIPLWVYKEKGLSVAFRYEIGKLGGVVYLAATEGYTGRGPGGIRIGDPEASVLTALGANPARVGGRSVSFGIKGGRVSSIVIDGLSWQEPGSAKRKSLYPVPAIRDPQRRPVKRGSSDQSESP